MLFEMTSQFSNGFEFSTTKVAAFNTGYLASNDVGNMHGKHISTKCILFGIVLFDQSCTSLYFLKKGSNAQKHIGQR